MLHKRGQHAKSNISTKPEMCHKFFMFALSEIPFVYFSILVDIRVVDINFTAQLYHIFYIIATFNITNVTPVERTAA